MIPIKDNYFSHHSSFKYFYIVILINEKKDNC